LICRICSREQLTKCEMGDRSITFTRDKLRPSTCARPLRVQLPNCSTRKSKKDVRTTDPRFRPPYIVFSTCPYSVYLFVISRLKHIFSATELTWTFTTLEQRRMEGTTVPARRRRHSGSMDNNEGIMAPTPSRFSGVVDGGLLAPPRPKSTPGERPTQRRRQKSPVHSSDSERENEVVDPNMQIDEGDAVDTEEPSEAPITILKNTSNRAGHSSPTTTTTATAVGTTDRPTRPLPASKARKMASTAGIPANPYTPIHTVANPSMLPVQAHVPKGADAASSRRLFVILEQACLEAYKVSGGGGSGGGKGRGGKDGGEAKYTLLNCDDHQGILAKTGRDIADARPDITHQVCLLLCTEAFVRSCADYRIRLKFFSLSAS